MKFSKELMEKAKKAASPEELKELAAAEGVTLTNPEAGSFFAYLNSMGAMTEEELEMVAGGKGGGGSSTKPAKYHVGQRLEIVFTSSKTIIHGTINNIERYPNASGKKVIVYTVWVEELRYEMKLDLEETGYEVMVM